MATSGFFNGHKIRSKTNYMAIALEYREIEVDKLGLIKILKNDHFGPKKACKKVSLTKFQKELYFAFN